jgi:hypothetical protein
MFQIHHPLLIYCYVVLTKPISHQLEHHPVATKGPLQILQIRRHRRH